LVTLNQLGKANIDKYKFINNIFTLRFISAIIVLIIACALIWFFPYAQTIKLGVLITSLSVFFMLLDQLSVSIFQKELKTITPSIVEIISKAIILGSAILGVKLNLNLLYILWGIVIAHGLHFIINFIFVNKIIKIKFDFDLITWKKILKLSWPIAITGIFSLIYFKADTIILSLYHSQSTVGLYGASYKVLEVLIAFPAIFMGLVSPQLSRFYSEKNHLAFQKIFNQAFNLLSIIVLPMILGTIALATPIINLIAGSEFLSAAPILKILIIACGIIFLAHLSTFTVVSIGKQKAMIKYYIFSAILALLAYFLFIPAYSYWAAAIITVLVELFIFLSSLIIVKKNTQIKIDLNIFLRACLASLIMFILLTFILHLNIFLLVIIGILSYSIFLFLFKGISIITIKTIFNFKL